MARYEFNIQQDEYGDISTTARIEDTVWAIHPQGDNYNLYVYHVDHEEIKQTIVDDAPMHQCLAMMDNDALWSARAYYPYNPQITIAAHIAFWAKKRTRSMALFQTLSTVVPQWFKTLAKMHSVELVPGPEYKLVQHGTAWVIKLWHGADDDSWYTVDVTQTTWSDTDNCRLVKCKTMEDALDHITGDLLSLPRQYDLDAYLWAGIAVGKDDTDKRITMSRLILEEGTRFRAAKEGGDDTLYDGDRLQMVAHYTTQLAFIMRHYADSAYSSEFMRDIVDAKIESIVGDIVQHGGQVVRDHHTHKPTGVKLGDVIVQLDWIYTTAQAYTLLVDDDDIPF